MGEIAPDFSLSDDTGEMRSLGEFLAKGPVVLFFFPATMTTGCTIECRHFRDLGPEFGALGVQRIGISRDPVQRQTRFLDTERLRLPVALGPRRGRRRVVWDPA